MNECLQRNLPRHSQTQGAGGQGGGFLFLLTSAPSVCAGRQPFPKAKLNKVRYRMRACLIGFHGKTAERSDVLVGFAVGRRETPARAIFPITVSWHHSPQAPARPRSHCRIWNQSKQQKAVSVILVHQRRLMEFNGVMCFGFPFKDWF